MRASITRLTARLIELEDRAAEPATANQAQLMRKKLESLDADFKKHHYTVIDAITDEEEDGMAREQEILDKHDDDVADLSFRMEKLAAAPAARSGERSVAARRLSQLQARLTPLHTAITNLTTDASDLHLVYLYQEQLSDFKKELSGIRSEVLALIEDESEELNGTITRQDKEIFDVSLDIKKLLYNPDHAPDPIPPGPITEPRGVRLPKIDVPTFNGDLLQWQTFWEQFRIAVHNRRDLSATEKLVYLRHSLKDGPAKSVVEGLSHSGDQYTEAIESLKSRYDRPRLIHQAHVRKICEVPSLKEGTGKENSGISMTLFNSIYAP